VTTVAASGTRSEKLAFGIAEVSLGQTDRQIPVDEPPPLAPNTDLAAIGKPIARVGGHAMVTGAARYTVDVRVPGMLFARILRSPHAHARIRSIDTAAAERHAAVRAVHVVTERDGRAAARASTGGAAGALPPALYAGASIAAVAATTRNAADEAIRLIKVTYEVLPFVVDMDEARRPDAPLAFDGGGQTETGRGAPGGLPAGNVRGPTTTSFYGGPRGDVERGFGEAEVIVEGEFRTQVQTHCCLEPHAIVADWRTDGLTVYISTQDTVGVRNDLAAAFGLPRERVRVITEFMGGGFGSKLSVGDCGYIAVHLSRKAGAPVCLIYDRAEEQQVSGNRPGTWQRLRIGARRDGTLTAISLLSYGTAGIAPGAGVGNIAQAMYECPNFEMAQYDVFTHAGPGCAMRAPGNVQGAFALEQSVDQLAEKLGLDPLALRDRIDPSAVRREERRIGAARFGWSRRRPAAADAGAVKRGLGMAQSFWPGIVQTSASCEVRLWRDGVVELRSSVQDIGSGIRTVLAQVVAEELGLRPEHVSIRIGDTDYPAGVSSGGSKTAGSITPAARKAAYRVRQGLFAAVAPAIGVHPDDLAAGHERIFVRANPSLGIGFRQAAGLLNKDYVNAVADRGDNYGGFRIAGAMSIAREDLGGVQFAKVTVDTETGIVRVEHVVAVHDCGRPMNPRQIESQIHGGIVMGISFALFENRVLDRNTGLMLNADLEHYKLAGPRETPAIDVALIENYQAISATDACGVGEPATIATAAAVANAVYNAIGVRLRELPMTPASILAALDRIPNRT
jgi:xanthine dehydrogenase YagR molybdenum-binding subunit